MFKKFFVVFVIAYLLRTLYLLGYGDWRFTRAFHVMFRRYLMCDILPMLWDAIPIGAIFWMHHKTFTKPLEQLITRESF
jgi:hypothetical protein